MAELDDDRVWEWIGGALFWLTVLATVVVIVMALA